MIVFHEDLEVKHNAVIYTVYWCAAVQDAVRDKNNISCVIGLRLIIDRQMKAAG